VQVGFWDYWRRPAWRDSWGGPFNGQELRQRLFLELCARVPFLAIVETGTYRGTTTEYLHRTTRLPVHTFEVDPRNYGFARARFMSMPEVHLRRCQSLVGLADLARSRVLPPGPVFFYLDAHRPDEEPPLLREIRLALTHWPEAVIMIDDFAVPDDPGYGFDTYGPDGGLTLEYLGETALPPTALWLPARPSSGETGARRGCVVLARGTGLIRQIDQVKALRRWMPAAARHTPPPGLIGGDPDGSPPAR
jgi:hypothetical protein